MKKDTGNEFGNKSIKDRQVLGRFKAVDNRSSHFVPGLKMYWESTACMRKFIVFVPDLKFKLRPEKENSCLADALVDV